MAENTSEFFIFVTSLSKLKFVPATLLIFLFYPVSNCFDDVCVTNTMPPCACFSIIQSICNKRWWVRLPAIFIHFILCRHRAEFHSWLTSLRFPLHFLGTLIFMRISSYAATGSMVGLLKPETREVFCFCFLITQLVEMHFNCEWGWVGGLCDWEKSVWKFIIKQKSLILIEAIQENPTCNLHSPPPSAERKSFQWIELQIHNSPPSAFFQLLQVLLFNFLPKMIWTANESFNSLRC